MRIRELFTVPDGKKVTEKAFGRVLVSSICSILLCMACLASTTWAWFAVSIVNTENVIQIGTPEVTVTVDDNSFTSGDNLPAGEYLVNINRTVNQDDLQQKMKFFVILTIQSGSEPPAIYKIAVSESSSVAIKTNSDCKLSWEASWFAPASADEISDGVIMVTTEDDTDPSAEPTTTPSTEATEVATEAATIPTATGKTTEPTEITPATEETTIPAADATTVPTSIPTDATEPVNEPDGTTSPTGTG